MLYYSSTDMDLFSLSPLPSLLLWTTLTLIFLFSFFTLHKPKSSGPNRPPGKTGWPIIGESIQYLILSRKGRQEEFISKRRNKYSSEIFCTSLFGHDMVFFCGPAANKFLFANEGKLVGTWWPNTFDKLFFSDPSVTSSSITAKAKLSRDLISGFLKMNVLQNYVPTMDRVAREHVEKEWEPKAGGEVVVHQAVKKLTVDLACQLLVGIEDPEHWAELADRFAGVFAGIASMPIDFPGTTFNKAIKDARFLRKELGVIIRERKTRLEKEGIPTVPDLVSSFLLTTDEHGKFMTVEDIADKIMGLLIAGFETTSVALTFTIKYLAELPHVYQEVFKEMMEIAKEKTPGELLNWGDIQKMRYTWNVTCEAMRLTPPAQILFKEALTDFTFDGYTIPKGWKVCWSFHSTHIDPEYFPNPEVFDPTRFEGKGPEPYTYVPFGGGQRMCPGKEYVRMEILVFIYNLVQKFHWKKCTPNERIIFKSPEHGLPICLTPHETSSS
ncbi:hypothetical protein Vadar_014987 [Vaccinium darrowii]|uniref:Uncharacterized protein n=1 Tax=Vaccinium darrowii TaxID=229202 RepID=A0ACB7Z458_9ERIC|nr:hypothetical protein Vadar_014987 [Vaccinium darrowii]